FAADANDQLVENLFLVTFLIRVLHGNFRALAFLHRATGYFGAELDVQTLFRQDLQRFLRDLLIDSGKEAFGGFEHDHFSAEARPHRAELQADHASANDAETFRYFLEFERAGGVDDDVVIERRRRNVYRHRAGGNDDVVRSEGLLAAVVRSYFDLFIFQHLAAAGNAGDLVGLEQAGNAACQLLHNLRLARDHRGHIDFNLAHLDAVHVKVVRCFEELVRGIEQCLRRNAADVQAGAA